SKTIKVEFTEHPKNLAETSQSEDERVYTSTTPTSGGGSWLDQIQPRLHFGHKARQKIPRVDGECISKKRTMQFNKAREGISVRLVERPEQEASGASGPLGGRRGKVRSERENNGIALVETALKRLSAQKMTNARFPCVLLRITS
ncbi:hypothetical protein ALC60_02221, partial [Trachymyrmex zeteki]